MTPSGDGPLTGSPTLGTPSDDMRRTWRLRSFRSLALSRTVSLFGDSAAPVALAFGVLGLPSGNATDLGLVLLSRTVTQIVVVLFGGVIADRCDRARLMIGADVIAGASQLVAAILLLTGSASVSALSGIAAVNGAAAAVVLPASSGLLPQLVPPDLVRPANMLMRLGTSAAAVAGASLSGVVVAGAGPGWGLVADSVTFLVSAALLWRVPIGGGLAPGRSGLLADLREGWHEFAGRPWVWRVVVQFAVVNACTASGIQVLGPVVADERLGGPAAWSVVLGAQSAGVFLGTFALLRVHPRRPLRIGVLATLGFVPQFFLIAVGAPLWAIAVSTFVSGVSTDFFTVFWSTSLQVHIPTALLSRISSYDALGSYLLKPVGLAVAGPLASTFGVSQVLVVFGALAASFSIFTLASRDVWRLPDTPRDAGKAVR
ncbi:MFS transporter [Pseudonocardia phyllosphaerae]|uniref:MFS transporter n=1 Tax=Pseudonocardia phyllosphaerae TaxID=3390502 RepID=UPI00397B71D7